MLVDTANTSIIKIRKFKMEIQKMIKVTGYKNAIEIAKKLGIDLNRNGRLIRKSDMQRVVEYYNRENAKRANHNNPNFNPRKAKTYTTVSEVCNRYNIEIGAFLIIGQAFNKNLRRADSRIDNKDVRKIVDAYYAVKKMPPKMGGATYQASKSLLFENLLKSNYMVFFDTSSLMEDNIQHVIYKEVIPALQKYKKRVYIVDSVFHEINKLVYSHNPDKAMRAKRAQKAIDLLGKHKLYYRVDTNSASKTFADHEFISLFTNQRIKSNLCLITNNNSYKKDGALAGTILRLQEDTNVYSKYDIKVMYLKHTDGYTKLDEFHLNQHKMQEYRIQL